MNRDELRHETNLLYARLIKLEENCEGGFICDL